MSMKKCETIYKNKYKNRIWFFEFFAQRCEWDHAQLASASWNTIYKFDLKNDEKENALYFEMAQKGGHLRSYERPKGTGG